MMKIKKAWLLLAAVFLLSLSGVTAGADNRGAGAAAAWVRPDVYINGNFTLISGYNINGNTYYRLRDLAVVFNSTEFKFDVVWNAEENAVEIITGQEYSDFYAASAAITADTPTAYKTGSALLVDGKKTDVTAYNIENSNFYMLRDLGDSLGFGVNWDAAENRIDIYFHKEESQSAERTGTDISHEYLIDELWASPVRSVLNDNGDGTISAVSADSSVHIDTYDSDTEKLLYSNEVNMESDIFGGVYFGSEYNFIVFGQTNLEESSSKTTFKTVKYSKDWKLIDAADYKDNNTVVPFHAGSLRMTEYKGYLYVHTSHQMYTDSDGLNEQASLTYSVKIDTMEIADSFSGVKDISYGYCSHSFDQYIAVDNGKLICLDLGDAYPRAVVMGQYGNSLDSGKFISGGSYKSVELLSIPGSIGANCTGVSIGGLAIGSKNYIVPVSKIDFSKAESFDNHAINGIFTYQRDAVLLISSKDNFGTDNVKQVKLTDYSGNYKSCSTPYILSVGDNKYAVIWNEYNFSNGIFYDNASVKYVFTDEDGNMLSDINDFDGELGCQPIYTGGKVLWCVNKDSARYFYSIEP